MSIKATVKNRLGSKSLNVKENEGNAVTATVAPGSQETVPAAAGTAGLKSIDVEVDEPAQKRGKGSALPISVWPPPNMEVAVKPKKNGRAWKLTFNTIATIKSAPEGAASGPEDPPDDIEVTIGPDDPPPEGSTSSAMIFIAGVAVGLIAGVAVGALLL